MKGCLDGCLEKECQRDSVQAREDGQIQQFKSIDSNTYASEFIQSNNHSYTHLFLIDCNIPKFQPKNLQFLHLRTLSLDNNYLQSIQSLNLIQMPNIQSIFLFNNNIISLKPLTKFFQHQNLKQLSISMNPLKQPLFYLSLCELGSLRQLRLYSSIESINNFQSITLCAKLNCYFIEQLGVNQQLGPFKIKENLIRNLFRNAK